MTWPRDRRAAWVTSALERFEGPLLRYAAHLLGRWDRAQDIVQTTFLKLCREDPERLDGHLKAWLFRVCRNEAITLKRRERWTRPLEDEDAAGLRAGGPSPASLVEAEEDLGRVLAALGTLPRSQQEVLRLKFQESLSYREISAVTGLSVSNVGVLIHTGLKSLRAHVAREERPPLRRVR